MNPARTLLWVALYACSLLPGAVARASDGQLEINHACALTTGCFTGDTPGYPVRITTSASYRLTGSLLPGTADGIVIAAGVKMVTIDLGGFRIEGSGAGTGMGIRGESGASAISVRNGTVVSMGDDGINIGGSAVLEAVNALGNGGDGFDVNQTSRVRDGRIVGNGGYGIRFSDNLSLYSGNVFSGNTAGSVYLGKPGEANSCDDGTCQVASTCQVQRRRFYLTQDTFYGDQPLTACAQGFHMASLWEIHEPSNLEYDTSRGFTNGDSGSGPPTTEFSGSWAYGWIRTGAHYSASAGGYGVNNCNGWGTRSGLGTGVNLASSWWYQSSDPTETPSLPFGPERFTCDGRVRVWCVED